MQIDSNKIEKLRPWRYNHYFKEKLIIEADGYGYRKDASIIHDQYGKLILKHILEKISLESKNFENFRVLDLGCLEGHYSDIMCSFGFKEVVSIDLSNSHVERAKFLLKEIRMYENSKILQGNVLDQELMTSLGKFDLIFFHGLLYHLSSPVMIFDIIEKLINTKEEFYLLLNHQFHMNWGNTIQSMPMAQVKFREIKDRTSRASEFDAVSIRLNIESLYKLIQTYGYQDIIAYNKPKITKRNIKNYDIQLILTKNKKANLINNLNENNPFFEHKFYFWKGRSVSNYILDKQFSARIIRFLYRLLNKFASVIGRKNW